ncbi:MAG: MBL fold metallo-hydrolase [Bacteroidales bacterium]|nr:MBL fold metallo-hydrolase [Bacteroidales bacterium]
MTLTVLTDNHAGKRTAAEHGLSYLVEHDNKRILFDTGQSDIFLTNSAIIGVDPEATDLIILSHGHYDHGNGLRYMGGQHILCHPGCFVKRYGDRGKKYIGLAETFEELSSRFMIRTSADPYRISDRITFLGEIPRISRYESKTTEFTLENGEPDYVDDDSAVVLELEEGLFIITGCGHAGIINTAEYARKVTGNKDIAGIMGGFHLKHNNRQTRETIDYLRSAEVQYIYPSHCTELPALAAFHKAFGTRLITTGGVLVI